MTRTAAFSLTPNMSYAPAFSPVYSAEVVPPARSNPSLFTLEAPASRENDQIPYEVTTAIAKALSQGILHTIEHQAHLFIVDLFPAIINKLVAHSGQHAAGEPLLRTAA